MEEKIAIINKIARAAHDLKLEIEDVVDDRFVTTIGANPFFDTVIFIKSIFDNLWIIQYFL